MMLRVLAVCFLAHAALAAEDRPRYPEEEVPPEVTDWNNLNLVLARKGVPITNLDWFAINRRCGGNPAERNDSPEYNRCRYVQVMTARVFEADRRQCRDEAFVRYPERLAYASRTREYESFDSYGNHRRTVVERRPPVSRRELEDLREAYLLDCMKDAGWRNYRDWTAGRR